MHLAQRAYVLLILTAALAVAGLWSEEGSLAGLWLAPAILLLAGLTLESLYIRGTIVRADIEIEPRAFLGRAQPATIAFHNESDRDVRVEYVAVLPSGFEPLIRVDEETSLGRESKDTRIVSPVEGAIASGQSAAWAHPLWSGSSKITVPKRHVARDTFDLIPSRLGLQRWPSIPSRLRGRFGLAWWPRELTIERETPIAPDTLRIPVQRPTGAPTGMRPRRTEGAGSELHQLRAYFPGDPLGRIDWKATARRGRLVSREFSEDQHLDILVAIDAGRLSRIRAGNLDRLGLFANIAARFAETATPNDDRIGLLVYSDRTLAVCAPDRGVAAVVRMRRALERLSVQSAESDPLAAAIQIRSMLRHRSLIVLLTDPEDATLAEPLARAVRLLSPPHMVVVAGVHSPEIAALANAEAHDWLDPWVALAAQEHEFTAQQYRERLRRLGTPVIAAREDLLERAVFAEYEHLRRSRRIG